MTSWNHSGDPAPAGGDYRRPPRRINELVHHKHGITADTALRLARFFNTTPDFRTSLQASYDTELVRPHILEVLDAFP
jgi:plasmid maintenance system antidote protein VapI